MYRDSEGNTIRHFLVRINSEEEFNTVKKVLSQEINYFRFVSFPDEGADYYIDSKPTKAVYVSVNLGMRLSNEANIEKKLNRPQRDVVEIGLIDLIARRSYVLQKENQNNRETVHAQTEGANG